MLYFEDVQFVQLFKDLKFCSGTPGSQRFIGIWVPQASVVASESSTCKCLTNLQAVFDLYVLLLLFLNILDKPRSTDQKVLKAAYEDGFVLMTVSVPTE